MVHRYPYFLVVEESLAHGFVIPRLDLRVVEVASPVERVVEAFVGLFLAS
jgi:hypothetical protein